MSEHTDFARFEWKVGFRFPNREAFRQSVAKYAVVQGKNLAFVSSNKNRQ